MTRWQCVCQPLAQTQGWADSACDVPVKAILRRKRYRPAPRYLTDNEAAAFLRLCPRTLEQRVIGGGRAFTSSASG